jgi:hypothetical protein
MRNADVPHAPLKSMSIGWNEKSGVQPGATVVPRSTFLRISFRVAFSEPTAPAPGRTSAFRTSDRLYAPTLSRTVMSIAWQGMSAMYQVYEINSTGRLYVFRSFWRTPVALLYIDSEDNVLFFIHIQGIYRSHKTSRASRLRHIVCLYLSPFYLLARDDEWHEVDVLSFPCEVQTYLPAIHARYVH